MKINYMNVINPIMYGDGGGLLRPPRLNTHIIFQSNSFISEEGIWLQVTYFPSVAVKWISPSEGLFLILKIKANVSGKPED